MSKSLIVGMMTVVLGLGAFLSFGRTASAACTAPSTDYGTDTITFTVPSTATYRLWSRIMAPNNVNNTYLLEVDGGSCYNVGGGIPASSWTWVDYQSGVTSNLIQQSLVQGTHTFRLIGNKPGLKVDRVVALSDPNCIPTGSGDNCNTPSDTTPPAVTLTTPLDGATVSGLVSVAASATDNVGVTKVEFYDNSTLISTDTTAPYTSSWDSSKAPNGSHVISARAYDAAGNVSTDSSTVTAKNGDTQAPSVPTNVKAIASSYNAVNLTWKASTDNTAVTGYTITRDGVPVANVGAVTSYTDTPLSANTTYTYQILAYDAAGNKSANSSKVSVKTQTVLDTQAPSAPADLTATAASPSQINLTWKASTDNIGVVSYDIYRSTGSGDPKVVGNSPTPSFGDSNLRANTTYAYYVVAKDASNNQSSPSSTVTAQTLALPSSHSSISGVITNQANKKAIPHARVVITINGNHHTYQADRFGRYAIFNLKPGRYNLTFRAAGYYSKTISVQLGSSSLTQNMTLGRR